MRVVILNEDRAKCAPGVIEDLARASFRILIAEVPQTHRMTFVPAEGHARDVMIANQWKNKKRNKLVELIRYIATELVRGSFVFFHSDGDTVWSTREKSPNRTHFDRIVRAGVRNLLIDRDRSTAEEVMTRLHLMMPFWCIESWLYQNTVVALRLCRDRGLDADRALFEAWAADRTLLDEVPTPKKAAKQLGDHGNAELAKAFPADVIYGQSPSFTAFIDELLADDALLDALRATAR